MRTTIRMDDALLADAKRHAIDTQRSLTQLIRDAVVALLQRERGAQSPRSLSLPAFLGDGVRDGIDIDNSAGLLDSMELRGDPDSHT
jgi:hypothetical protein